MGREKFTSGFAVFFATLGSAVGLGNIWKFPYLTGQFGGGAFLLTYLICIVFIGLPVMISEFYIGRKARKNAVGAFVALGANPRWKSIGFMGILSAYLIMFFYSCVAGWVYSYAFKAIKGDFASITMEKAKDQFGQTMIGPLVPIVWQIIVMTVVSIILVLGVKKGIERITKTLMPVLFILIIICDIRALTLPGANEGLRFLFMVDFGKLTGAAVLTALGLAFFKLSLGMGTMITYGSYFTEDNKMVNTAAKVALSDTLVSLLAGIAIFPTVFSFHMDPAGGPGLLFMTIPLVFSKVQFGGILLVLFFLLASIAATTAMISLVEVPVAYFTEEKGMSRKKSVIINALVIVVFGVFATLSADRSSLLGNIPIFGKTFFNLFDFISSNLILPLGGLLIVLFIGYATQKEKVLYELTNNGSLKNSVVLRFYFILVKFITPALLILVFLNSSGLLGLLRNLLNGLF